MAKAKKVMIGLSWVYANGRLHIGHLCSSLPADIIARYHRLIGNDVSFVTGSDCYGTPILVGSRMEGLTPQAFAEKYHDLLEQDFKKLNFSFDNYGKTMGEYHNEFAMQFHSEMYDGDFIFEQETMQLHCGKCDQYLPDRYVEGICPHCKKGAKGDSCDGCGKILEPEELISPTCKLCGATPAPKKTSQLYLKLSALQNKITDFYKKNKKAWTANAQGLTARYLNEGLVDRAITRNITWGVPVPKDGWDDKKIYIWAENVLGYLSMTRQYAEQTGQSWQDYLLDTSDSKKLHYYVHAKDNIPFHAIILPGLMLANPQLEYHKPDIICSSEYVTMDGKKMSKSVGNLITAQDLYDKYDVDMIRFYLSRIYSSTRDANFTFADFVNTVNGELINNFGNLVNRSLSFVQSKFGGRVRVFKESELNAHLLQNIKTTYKEVGKLICDGKVNKALQVALDLINFGNQYFNNTAPWKSYKTDLDLCQKNIFETVVLIANVVKMLGPFIPATCAKVRTWLGLADDFKYVVPKKDFTLPEIEVLFQRVELV